MAVNGSQTYGGNSYYPFWPAIVTKAWTKVKGNFMLSQGDSMSNSIRALTGSPVFNVSTLEVTDTQQLDTMFRTIQTVRQN